MEETMQDDKQAAAPSVSNELLDGGVDEGDIFLLDYDEGGKGWICPTCREPITVSCITGESRWYKSRCKCDEKAV